MPLAHFTNIYSAMELWVISGDFYYIGPKSKDFTNGEKYTIYTGGSKEGGTVTYSDRGKCHLSVKIKDNFISMWKYPQYIRKKKLEKLNSS